MLVVDDDPAVREMVSTTLELEGFKTVSVSSGEEAILQAHKNPPHAVVLDLRMPGLDGFGVCKKLREDPMTSRSVILVLSAFDKVDARVGMLKAGADDFLAKPFEPSELVARLHAHLRRMTSQQEKEKMLERLAEKLAEMNQRLEQEAATDSLTRLYNRRHFWKRFEEEYQRAKRFNHPLSFILIDLDRFKSINDQYGHPTGDKVLKEVGKLLRSFLRGIDIAARYGGEEFAIVLPETPLENAVLVGQRLLAAFNELQISPLPMHKLTFSAGVATFPVHAKFLQKLYEKADEALYVAKAQGRNRVIAASY